MTVTTTTSTMASKKRTSPQDWIQDYFSPVLSVYANEDVERIAAKNNLTFTEMLQPFSKMMTDVTIKDVDGTNHNVPSLNIILQDFKKDPVKLVNQKLMLDRIGEENADQLVTKHFDKTTLDAPAYTPWFDTWMKFYLATLPTVDHEYLKHHLGCIFVVSTNSQDPVEQLRTLSQNQQRHQHDRSGSGNGSYPQYFNPNILKYYVLVHDSYSTIDDAAAQELFTQVQNAFDSPNCHFLQVNSRAPQLQQEEIVSSSNISEHWFGFTHRWLSVETRRGKSFTSGMSTSPPKSKEDGQQDLTPPDHPLARLPSISDSPAPHQPTPPRLSQATPKNVGTLLTANDIDRIRILIRELVIKCLIPYVEKQLRLLHEVVTNKKSRSLFSGAKRWFGTNKPGGVGGGGSGTSVVYGREAPELQVRKLADLYFLMRLYKPAYNYAYISKKDFQADEAWPYYAAAVELASLAMFMLSFSDPGKKYRTDYMEDAITKYLTLCQSPEFAVRATLFDGLCLKHLSMFPEAATSYIRMTNELSDLRSAMLLEQAAYCFLLANPVSIRKYGFHIVLAGYRFTKTGGCKKHAARLYTQGAQVYSGQNWQLSSDHILYTLGHMKFMLKDFSAAAEFFNTLMDGAVSAGTSGGGHLQQMVHLREYFLVHHARAKEDKGSVVVITLPKLHCQDTRVSLVDEKVTTHQLNTWQSVEKVTKETASGQDMVTLSSTCQPVFDNTTTNHLQPEPVIGEPITVLLSFENVFNTPLQIRKAHLTWKFTPEDSDVIISSDNGKSSSSQVETVIVDSVTLDKQSMTKIQFSLTVNSPGQLLVTGVEYSLKALFPDKEPTDHEIRGKQVLTIVPRSFNTVKDRKNRTVVGVDKRLELKVKSAQPRLAVKLVSPETLVQGELRCLELELVNNGPVPMTNLHMICQTPGLVSFGKRKARVGDPGSLYDFPLIQDTGPAFKKVKEDGFVEQMSLDMIPVPLADSKAVLNAGVSVRLPLWIRGPASNVGTGQHYLYMYYDTAEPGQANKGSPRIYPLSLDLTVQPSIVVECSRVSPLRHSNTPGANLVVKMQNKSKDLVTSMDSVTVNQVVLVSRGSEMHQAESSKHGWILSRGETNHLSFRSVIKEQVEELDMERLVHLPATVFLPGGDLHFSSLITSTSSSGHNVQSPPFLDFIKNHLSYNLGKRGNAPVLRDDLLVVMWRSCGPSPFMGQTVVPVIEEEVEGNEEVIIPLAPSYPVEINVKIGNGQINHDFTTSRHVSVNVVLEIGVPDGQEKGFLIQYRSEQQLATGVRMTGNTDGLVWMDKGSSSTRINIGVTVSRPGFYKLDSWEFRAKQMGTCDMDFFQSEQDAKFLPVDICFTVKHLKMHSNT